MHEDILTRGPLDKTIPFCPVEPLYCTLLSHRSTPFASVDLPWPFARLGASTSPLKKPERFTSGSVLRRRLSPKKVKALRLPGKRLRGTGPELYNIAGFDDVAQNISPNSVLLP